MSSIIKALLCRGVNNDLVWKLLDSSIIRFARFAERNRRNCAPHSPPPFVVNAIGKLFPDMRVAHGPFRGMKYPAAQSIGSSLFPKLLGSYEAELSSVLEKICKQPYTEIVDIGSAEGFYAVGLAMRIPNARVIAYDTDPRAIELCREMACLNGIQSRILTSSLCNAEILKALPLTERALLVCDCEGCELQLFTEDLIRVLERHDLLIETHDFLNIHISATIRQRFQKTHRIEVIQSIDDIKKAQTYQYAELASYTLDQRRALLAERRPAIMEWLFMTPKARLGISPG